MKFGGLIRHGSEELLFKGKFPVKKFSWIGRRNISEAAIPIDSSLAWWKSGTAECRLREGVGTVDPRLLIAPRSDGFSEQLQLFETAQARMEEVEPVRGPMPPRGLFANDELDMDEIKVVGFDFDYTLAPYNRERLSEFIYRAAVDYLIQAYSYPSDLRKLLYDPSFAVRGLHIDRATGVILKLDSAYRVSDAYFGRRRLSPNEIIKFYPSHSRLRKSHTLVFMSDLFALPEICLMADVVSHFEEHRLDFDPASVYRDVRDAISAVHSNHALHRELSADFETYLDQAHSTPGVLRRIRESGRKLFLLSNSPFWFVDKGMTHLFESGLGGGGNWRETFDYVMVDARKPKWFSAQQPFRRLIPGAGGSVSYSYEHIRELQSGQVYAQGCVSDFSELTNIRPRSVLYFGDHLGTDIMEPRGLVDWRTGFIIDELEHEVATQNTDIYQRSLARLLVIERLISETTRLPVFDERAVEKWMALRHQFRTDLRCMFNGYFGSVFRTATKPTLFAQELSAHADLYTSHIDNLDRLFSNRSQVLLPSRLPMPHESSPYSHLSRPLSGAK